MRAALFGTIIVLIFWANPALVQKTLHWAIDPAVHAWKTGDDSEARKLSADVPDKGSKITQKDIGKFRDALAVPGGQVEKPSTSPVEKPNLAPVDRPNFAPVKKPNLGKNDRPNVGKNDIPNLGKTKIPREYIDHPPGIAVSELGGSGAIADALTGKLARQVDPTALASLYKKRTVCKREFVFLRTNSKEHWTP